MTADILDDASEHEQELRDDAINEVRRRIEIEQATRYDVCQWCGEPTLGGDRYCSHGKGSCAEDAAKHARMTSAAYRRGK